MKSTRTRAVRRRLPEEERRAQILRAAHDIARARGLEAVTARSVAKAAGLSSGLVFFHFESVEKLRNALVSKVSEETLGSGASVADHLASAQPIASFLAARLGHLDAARERRTVDLLVESWVRGLTSPAARRTVQRAARSYRDSFAPLAAAAIAREPARFAGVGEQALAMLVLSIVLGTAMQATIEPASVSQNDLARALDALLGPPARKASPRAPSRGRAAPRAPSRAPRTGG